MKKFLLTIGKVIAAFVGLIALWLASDWGWERYKFYSWRPPSTIDGIHLGMSKSDVMFQKGEATECELEKRDGRDLSRCSWREEYSEAETGVIFDNDTVDYVYRWGYPNQLEVPFSTVEEMKSVLGDEDIMSTSRDGISRSYTYAQHKFSFYFDKNTLRSVNMSEVTWKNLGGQGEYFVRGRQICPGKKCPFDAGTGEIKPEYQGMSYRDFLRSN